MNSTEHRFIQKLILVQLVKELHSFVGSELVQRNQLIFLILTEMNPVHTPHPIF